MEILAEIFVLLLLARLMGEGAERLGQPASVGELIAGILLAGIIGMFGSELPFLVGLSRSVALEHVASLGIFFLVLHAGMEMKPDEIVQRSGRSFLVACGGAILPLVAGFALAWYFLPETDHRQGLALLVGVVMSITAIPVTAKVLGELDLLHTQLGETVIAAALFDDVIGLFLLALLTAVIQTGAIPDLASLGILLGKVALFFGVTVGLGVHVYRRFIKRIKLLQAPAHEFSALMAVALAYAVLAELLDMHWILGAFMAGLYFEPARVGETAYRDMMLLVTGVTSGVLGPLFFAAIGLHVDLASIGAIPGFLALLIAVAFLGKLVGAGGVAALTGFRRRSALAVGIGMNARGAVGLIVLSVAFEAGLLKMIGSADGIVRHLYSALVLMVVFTTLLTPVLLRFLLPGLKRDPTN